VAFNSGGIANILGLAAPPGESPLGHRRPAWVVLGKITR
jgi:hypothetical protein